MYPRSTLNSCGSSSSEKARRNLPQRVIKGIRATEQGAVAFIQRQQIRLASFSIHHH